MRRKRFAVLVATLVVVASALYGLGVMGASAEAGGSDDLEFTYLVSPGRALIGPTDADEPLFCDQTGPNSSGATPFDVCPDLATAANGETIEMKGSGTLSIDGDEGEPGDVDGGGAFVHTIGGQSFTGTWEAKELLMFDSYGPGPEFGEDAVPQNWRAGRALILVRLVSDDTGMEADAILELGCRLNDPGVQPGGGLLGGGTIEGIRLLISGGQNFNMEADPRATLFIAITEEDD